LPKADGGKLRSPPVVRRADNASALAGQIDTGWPIESKPPETLKVVKAAVYLAKPFQSHITLMHVEWTEPAAEIIDFGAGPNLVPPPVRDEPEVVEARKKKLAELVELVTSVGLTSTTIERDGPPVDEILAMAERERVDLIVIGSHHHGALYHLFEGGVTEGILGRARCPVLIVPQTATSTGDDF
jgi:nucleotide-binding universal stress UspA family protein